MTHVSVGARRATWVAALALVVGSSAADAQLVRGRVVEENTGAPVAGAVVTLLGGNDARLGSALTTADGEWAVRAPGAGDYSVEVKRIGVRRVRSARFTLSEGESRDVKLTVATVPAVQPEVRVSGRTRCGEPSADGAALGAIWEDLRAALTAADLTLAQRQLAVHTITYRRRLDSRGSRVVSEQREEREGVTDAPFESMPPAALSRHGYIVELPTDSIVYYAPDAKVLVSEEFARDHCFRLVRGAPESPGLIGVRFDPVPGRRRPDIRGVVWMDRATRELRRVEYEYTRLPEEARNGPKFGGRVEFARRPTGAWIVSQWSIRVPMMGWATRATMPGPRPSTSAIAVIGVQETGGEVLGVTTLGRASRRPGARLRGTVVDDTRGVPLGGAVVVVAGTERADTTDERGRFELADLFEGSYGVTFSHSRADSLGFAPDTVIVELASGLEREVTLTIPPERVILQSLCPKLESADSSAAVRGVVRTPGGVTLANRRVAVTWNTFSVAAGAVMHRTPVELETRTDGSGTFLLCGVKSREPVLLQAGERQRVNAPVELRLQPRSITTRNLVVDERQ